MRIAHLAHSLRRGGAERVTLDLCVGMQARGHTVLAIGMLDLHEYREPPYDTVPFHALIPPRDYRWPWCIPALARRLSEVLKETKPDVLEVHSPTALIVAGWAGIGIPGACILHGHGSLTRGPSFRAWALRFMERRACRRWGPRLVAVSQAMVPAVAAHFGCAEAGVCCIPNGIDLHRFPFADRQPTDAPVICAVGTLAEVKRPDHAVQAFDILRRSLPNARLRMIGDGPLRPDLERLITACGLGDAVELLGCRPDVPALLATSHLFWQLSQSEGFGLAVAEAMASGLPVVGTDVRGIRDVVVNGETGSLVPFADVNAVAEQSLLLLRNAPCYRAFALAGRARVETSFDLKRMVEQHLKILLAVHEHIALRQSCASW